MKDEVHIGEAKPKSKYADLDFKLIIGRLSLANDKQRQRIEKDWKLACTLNKLDAWLKDSDQQNLKSECDNQIKMAITVSESDYVVSPKAEMKEAVLTDKLKKCGRQKFC